MTNLMSVVGVASSVPTSASTNHSLTLPSGIKDGDIGLLTFGANGTDALTGPSTWTMETGNFQSPSNSLRQWCFSKALSASDSGGTVSWSFAGSRRGVKGAIVLRGGRFINLSTGTNSGATNDTTSVYPNLTTTVDECLLVGLMGLRYIAGVSTVSEPGGWHEELDTCDTNGASPTFGIQILTKVAGAAGSNTGPSVTPSNSATEAAFMVAIAPDKFRGWGQPL